MFDFAWSEFGVIAVVALIFIGPKDMPVAIKAVTGMIKKARRMASEFQTHVDDMVRDADLHEVRDQISALRGHNLGRTLERLVDEDGSLRRTFTENPLAPLTPIVTPAPEVEGEVAVAERPAVGTAVADPAPTEQPRPESHALESEAPETGSIEPLARPDAPAFIPPGAALLSRVEPASAEAPAFIPPGIAHPGIAHTARPAHAG